jgi:hypothetical protein
MSYELSPSDISVDMLPLMYSTSYFDTVKDAMAYIQKYLYDYPTGITLAFGDIEIYRRAPYPYMKYGVTSSGIIFHWNMVSLNDADYVLPRIYIKNTLYGPINYISICTDYNTKEVIERARLVLLTFYQKVKPTDNILHIDGNTENDHMCNLVWA